MSEPRIDYAHFAQMAPDARKALTALGAAVDAMGVDKGLTELIKVRASQLNGCAFCVDMHVKEATLHGERALRLHHVAVWHESPLFTPRERAALAWTEVLTKLPPHGVPQADYAAVSEHFSEQELADLSFAVVAINGWNRLAIGFAAVPGSQDRAYGLDKAGLTA